MPIVLKSGSLNLLEPSGPVQACNGIFFMNQERHASEISKIAGCWHSHCFFSGTTESSFLTRLPVESDQHYGPHKVMVKVKVNCTFVQALRFCTGRTAHRGSRGIALPFLDHGTRRGWGVSVTPRPIFTPGKDPVPIVQEAGWAPGPVWTGVENFTPTRIWFPGRPACSKSLYRLRCQVQFQTVDSIIKSTTKKNGN